MALTNSQTDDDTTPLSVKRVLELKDDVADQSSTTKKLCLENVNLEELVKEQGNQIELENEEPKSDDSAGKNNLKNMKAVKVKIEKPK